MAAMTKVSIQAAGRACGSLVVCAMLAMPVLGQTVERYEGLCDASAGVALDGEHFVVADDERNTLLVFKRGQGKAVAKIELAAFLGTGVDKESDIEGAARIGQRIYWIASHGRNSKGKLREERYRFFATDVDATQSPPVLSPVQTPYRKLLPDLLANAALKNLKLDLASTLPPESPGGLNIEGLAATPEGKLLIGFRNPLPKGLALLVPLHNPQAVLNAQDAVFGPPMLLNLNGRGIRSIERVGQGYLIVAGPAADAGSFQLYRWSGMATEQPSLVTGVKLGTLRPEALFEVPGSDSLQILSDDGGVLSQGVACKDRPAEQRSFRSLSIKRPG